LLQQQQQYIRQPKLKIIFEQNGFSFCPSRLAEAVDEELDGELVESQVVAREYSMLIQSSDIELTEVCCPP
jgi:hypothetical protein